MTAVVTTHHLESVARKSELCPLLKLRLSLRNRLPAAAALAQRRDDRDDQSRRLEHAAVAAENKEVATRMGNDATKTSHDRTAMAALRADLQSPRRTRAQQQRQVVAVARFVGSISDAFAASRMLGTTKTFRRLNRRKEQSHVLIYSSDDDEDVTSSTKEVSAAGNDKHRLKPRPPVAGKKLGEGPFQTSRTPAIESSNKAIFLHLPRPVGLPQHVLPEWHLTGVRSCRCC
jgi:hypothetical protein